MGPKAHPRQVDVRARSRVEAEGGREHPLPSALPARVPRPLPVLTQEQREEIASLAYRAAPTDKNEQGSIAFRLQFGPHRLHRRADWIERFVKIKSTGGYTVPLVLNATQRYVYSRVLRQRRNRAAYVDRQGQIRFQRREVEFEDGTKARLWVDVQSGTLYDHVPRAWAEEQGLTYVHGHVWMIILKARQQGMSTLFQADIFERITSEKNLEALLVSHVDDSAVEVLDKMKFMVKQFPVKLPIDRSPLGGITFGKPINGSIVIASAKSDDPGRGGTTQLGHFTEVASWGPEANDLMNAAANRIHQVPGTMFVMESTAKGAQGYFYDQWNLASDGRSDFEPVFIPWFWSESYRQPCPPMLQREIESTLSDDERWLLQQTYFKRGHGRVHVDYEQLAWRRWAIVNKCSNSLDNFHQEYPAYPDEAFLASGRPVFDARIVQELQRDLKTRPEPVFRGDLDLPNFVEETLKRDIEQVFLDLARPKVVEDHYGPLWVWEEPIDGEAYCIGGDTSAGVRGGDASVAYVMKMRTQEMVARWRGWVDPARFGDILMQLHLWYGKALVGPEVNNHGVATVQRLVDAQCTNIYRRIPVGSIGAEPTRQLGWHTNVKSREQMINHLRRMILEREGTIRCSTLLQEMRGFHFDENGNMVPPDTGFDGSRGLDDCIFAWAITCQMRRVAHEHNLINADAPRSLTPDEKHWRQVEEELYGDKRIEEQWV